MNFLTIVQTTLGEQQATLGSQITSSPLSWLSFAPIAIGAILWGLSKLRAAAVEFGKLLDAVYQNITKLRRLRRLLCGKAKKPRVARPSSAVDEETGGGQLS